MCWVGVAAGPEIEGNGKVAPRELVGGNGGMQGAVSSAYRGNDTWNPLVNAQVGWDMKRHKSSGGASWFWRIPYILHPTQSKSM